MGKATLPPIAQVRQGKSHDIMFKSGSLTRESPCKRKQFDSDFEINFVTLKMETIFF